MRPELVGRWTLGQESCHTCTIELKDAEWLGEHNAYVPAGLPDGLFPANRWVLPGNQLLITDTNNTAIGSFRQDRGRRWSGQRESDSARLYLNTVGNWRSCPHQGRALRAARTSAPCGSATPR